MNINEIILKELINGKSLDEKASIKINTELAMEYLKWISYIPKNEQLKVNCILSKTARRLSLKEISILQKFKKNQELVEILKRYRSDKCLNKDVLDVYNLMNRKSLEKIIREKLTKDELEEANKIVAEYKKMSDQELNNYIFTNKKQENYEKLSIIESYVYHEINKEFYLRSNNRLEKHITSQIEQNEIVRMKSYKKTNN